MLKNVKIRTRLLFAFGVLLVLMVMVGVFSINRMNHLAKFTTDMYEHPLTVSNAVREAKINIIKMHRSMKDVTLAENPEQLTHATREVDRLEKIVLRELRTVEDNYLGDKKSVIHLRQHFKDWKEIRDEVIDLTQKKEVLKAANITKGKGAAYIKKLMAEMDSFTAFAGKMAATFFKNATDSQGYSILIVIIIIVLSILVSVIISFLITRSITGPVIKAATIADKLAMGDIVVDVEVNSQDELGQMLNSMHNMAHNLRDQIRELIEGVGVLATSAAEISATTAQFATTAQQVAASVNEVVVSMKEVKQTTMLSNDKAKDMTERSRSVVRISLDGEASVQQTVDSINSIQEQMVSIADSVVDLSEQGQSIGEIIAAVDDLADQSRLLAVNASIEAVKAGEQGKGFSVVAEEIRSLAQQSKQSTSQVRTILTDIQKATSTAVMATEKGSKAVESGVIQATQTGGAIRTLGESVDQTSQAAVQIEATSRQQSAGIDQVFSAMESINNSINQNADGARQLEQSARNLENLGKKLKKIVEKYVV